MILIVVGTRPELLKMAPVVREAKARGLPVHVHCTMQSPDLVDRRILEWDTDGDWLRHCLDHILQPKMVVVQGDTHTAFDAAVASYRLGFPVFHVEAGVRTYDLSAPWPEEGYRQMISRIARWHACTTEYNLANLQVESSGNWKHNRVTGSPIVESVRQRARGALDGNHILLTLHRRENRPHFADILLGVRDATLTKHHVTWPSHPNHWAVEANPTSLSPIPPMDPWNFAQALATAACVVTDSGGVQEEANALGVPCVVTRAVTDRPESLGDGGAIMGGVERETVAAAVELALQWPRHDIATDIFGDGYASKRIVDWWEQILTSSRQPSSPDTASASG